ncbi:neuronal acetylcholine receptor subunit alpha-2-like [Saccostrea echinata]|uniref:neuronal acetylcholine receptor subunit alpha-2-like n=1 Tax=Saccostrea echinata TaxID=191078 RepID=UPI002A80A3EC|nr:neuronal acetylcholine receptor subunit alpha-2-like [Saccostrea echinata]
MIAMKKIICAIILFCLLNTREFDCKRTEYLRNILQELFETRKYDKRIRPVQDVSDSVVLEISMTIAGINFVDEKSGVFSTTGFLEVTWKDHFLSWQPEMFGNITNFTFPQGNIWIPDLILRNGVKEIKPMGGDFYYILMNYTGHVTWWPYQVFEARCEIDVVYFPFDTQTCQMIFTVWNHDKNMVQIGNRSYLRLFDYYENGIWKIFSNMSSLELDESEMFVKLIFSFNLRRKYVFYLWNLIIPLLFLGIMKVFAFLIPAESGEKVSFTITLFLAYGVFLNSVTSSLPENSDSISLVCVYMEIELSLAVLTVLISSLQVKICNRDRHIRLSRHDVWLIKLLKKESSQKFIEREDDCETDWTILSSAIDKLMIIFLIIQESLTFCIFSIVIYTNAYK